MKVIDQESHEALRTLLADLIAEPIGKSIDEKAVPELQRALGQLGALAHEQSKLGRDVKAARGDIEEAVDQIRRRLDALHTRLGDEAIGADLQRISTLMEALGGAMAAVRALQDEEAARARQGASANRHALVLLELDVLKKLAIGALITSSVSVAGVVWLLLH